MYTHTHIYKLKMSKAAGTSAETSLSPIPLLSTYLCHRIVFEVNF